MAESSNSMGWTDFKLEVADFLGYGRTSTDWDTGQTGRIEACVHMGVRQFYQPPALSEQVQRGEGVHEWSFIKPTTTLTTTSGDYDQDAPDDFGSLAGPMYFAPTIANHRVEKVSEGMVLAQRQIGTTTDHPRMVAMRWTAQDGTTGQRAEFLFWPTPGGAYVLTYSYYVLQGKLTTAAPYPLGGAAHAKTIMDSCLDYAAGMYRTDQYELRHRLYLESLRGSIAHDNRFGWDTLGYNASHTAFAHSRPRGNPVQLEGVEVPVS